MTSRPKPELVDLLALIALVAGFTGLFRLLWMLLNEIWIARCQ